MKHRTTILIVLLLVGCNKAPYTGVWKGEVLFVKTEYTFNQRSFQFKTLTQNGIMIGGGEGSLRSNRDIMTLTQRRTYRYDSVTDKGYWANTDKKFDVKYIIEGDSMMYSPLSTEHSLKLVRVR